MVLPDCLIELKTRVKGWSYHIGSCRRKQQQLQHLLAIRQVGSITASLPEFITDDPRQLVFSSLVNGMSSLPARSFALQCGELPAGQTEFYGIQDEMLSVITKVAQELAQ
jgi:hypothetical protein